MARSKNLHFVQHTIEIEQPDDPEQNWASGVIQVDAELSKELGRTIRNGNSFRLVGYGASLRGFNSATDQDVGFAGTAVVELCPVTKNGVGAWQSLQKQWYKQKRLSSGVGKYVRFDDFEVGWSATQLLPVPRNSVIRMDGIGDLAAESIGIYGTPVDGTFVSLSGYYNNLNPIQAPSEDPFGAVIKTAKFEDKFPDSRLLLMPTSFSALPQSSLPAEGYAGGIATGDIDWLPSDNHLSHMTGTLYYYFKGIPGDASIPIADDLKLTITLVYEGWAPLAQVRSSKATTKKMPTTAARGKSTTKKSRRS
ncbi:MAG: hypothetical protein [Circular genetic element sp.]|nr:MAG: hypothetical protein [Circular genetic element sp.]